MRPTSLKLFIIQVIECEEKETKGERSLDESFA